MGTLFFLKCWDSICAQKATEGCTILTSPWTLAENKDLLWVHLLKSKYLRGSLLFMMIFLLMVALDFGLILNLVEILF